MITVEVESVGGGSIVSVLIGLGLSARMAGGSDRRERLSGSVGTPSGNPGFPRRVPMPLVQVKVIEGVFSDDQKQEIIRKLTDAMVSIEGEAMREVTLVIVEEVQSGSWGIGGKALTTADVKAMAGGG